MSEGWLASEGSSGKALLTLKLGIALRPSGCCCEDEARRGGLVACEECPRGAQNLCALSSLGLSLLATQRPSHML